MVENQGYAAQLRATQGLAAGNARRIKDRIEQRLFHNKIDSKSSSLMVLLRFFMRNVSAHFNKSNIYGAHTDSKTIVC